MFCTTCLNLQGSGNCLRTMARLGCEVSRLNDRAMSENEDFLEDAHSIMDQWERAEHYDMRQEGAH